MSLRLGKAPATSSAKDLLYEAHRDPEATIAVPRDFGHGQDFTDGDAGAGSWNMLGNDSAGDCVFAESAHTTMIVNHAAGRKIPRFTTESVLAEYSAFTGYDPVTGANDNGANMRDVMEYRRTTGLLDADGNRHKIAAYVSVEKTNIAHVVEAAYLFDFVAIGFQVPDYAMDQFNRGYWWRLLNGTPNIVGGHDVPLVGRHPNIFPAITWAKRQIMTQPFFLTFADEVWAAITEESLNAKTLKSDHGFLWSSLVAALPTVA